MIFPLIYRFFFFLVKEEEEEDEDMKPQTPSKAAGVRSGKLGVTVMKERWEPEPFWKVFVKGPLDGYTGIGVLINLAFMILETQSTGATADFSLGLSSDAGGSIDENFFQVAEYIFFSMLLDIAGCSFFVQFSRKETGTSSPNLGAYSYQYVPHKAIAEVSKIGNL